MSVILLHAHPFCKIAQSFLSFRQPFFKMNDAGSRGGRRLARGIKARGQALVGLVNWGGPLGPSDEPLVYHPR
jgi:hypothetical protein